jgi:hypothetical protein
LRERLPPALLGLLPRGAGDALQAGGWIVAPRDIAALWQPLAHDRHVHVLGEEITEPTPPPDDLPAAVDRIRRLLD